MTLSTWATVPQSFGTVGSKIDNHVPGLGQAADSRIAGKRHAVQNIQHPIVARVAGEGDILARAESEAGDVEDVDIVDAVRGTKRLRGGDTGDRSLIRREAGERRCRRKKLILRPPSGSNRW